MTDLRNLPRDVSPATARALLDGIARKARGFRARSPRAECPQSIRPELRRILAQPDARKAFLAGLKKGAEIGDAWCDSADTKEITVIVSIMPMPAGSACSWAMRLLQTARLPMPDIEDPALADRPELDAAFLLGAGGAFGVAVIIESEKRGRMLRDSLTRTLVVADADMEDKG